MRLFIKLKKTMKRKYLILLGLVLAFSILLNITFFLRSTGDIWYVTFDDANTRYTYETVHNVLEAQTISKGRGIKVGIIGKYFGINKHKDVFTKGVDFVDNKSSLEEIEEHGFWMATVLKEIAPGVSVYALNARCNDDIKEANAIVDAIQWAIENDLDILTYSGPAFSAKARKLIDKAVQNASDNNIVTTFIHYPLQENILPWLLSNGNEENYSRDPDLNIYHYDYNTLLLFKYEDYVNSGRKDQSGGDIPYFSVSSMSPVLAGFIAMLMELDRSLSPEEYRQILIDTSREFDYKGRKVKHVVDISKAVTQLAKNTKSSIVRN